MLQRWSALDDMRDSQERAAGIRSEKATVQLIQKAWEGLPQDQRATYLAQAAGQGEQKRAYLRGLARLTSIPLGADKWGLSARDALKRLLGTCRGGVQSVVSLRDSARPSFPSTSASGASRASAGCLAHRAATARCCRFQTACSRSSPRRGGRRSVSSTWASLR